MKKLKEGGVTQYTRHRIKEFKAEGVVAQDADGNEIMISCDTIVLANMTPNNELQYDGKGQRDVYAIGDAVVTRRANAAIHDGYRLAMTF